MKREIKFRGKRKTDGEWLYGYYFVNRGLHFIVTDDLAPAGNTFKDYEVDPETVGQYAELKDRKGKEIYEGDILHRSVPACWYAKGAKGTIEDDYEVCLDIGWLPFVEVGLEAVINGETENYTVIGNVHDNPELLKL